MIGRRHHQVWRSLTLRLGLIYVAIFLSSTAAMFGAAYWFGVYAPLLREVENVSAETDALVRLYTAKGRAGLQRALERREYKGKRRAFHALIASNGETLSANLPSWPDTPIDTWAMLEADTYQQGQEQDYEALVIERRLADGSRLIVGRDVEHIDDRDELLTGGSAWLMVIAALMAVLGSIAMSRAISARLDAVTRTARRVMAGSLTERIPRRDTGDDFDELAETLNLMLDRIEEAVESVRRVSDNVAHELRTPLARLHADLDDMRTAQSESERQRLAEQAVGEAERLQSIFDALLRIARIESGRHLAGVKPVNLSTLLADAVEFHAPDAEARGQRVETRIADGLTLDGDPNLLFQAISNLLDNAIKYGGDGCIVTVTARKTPSVNRIEISDSGPGIPAQYLERVKERFFRLPETAAQPGTGLGLALVSAIISLHKGTFDIEGASPGTRIVIQL